MIAERAADLIRGVAVPSGSAVARAVTEAVPA
jgi:hypothetical protein